MRIIPGNAQNIGQRKSQQDAFGYSDLHDEALTLKIGVLAILADGMGGLANGGEASRIAVQRVLDTYSSQVLAGATIPQALDQAVAAADAGVVAVARDHGQIGNVGTTLVALVVHDRQLHWRSAGDSRLYLWRKPYLIKVTEDHDYGQQLDRDAAAGRISADAAARDPQRRALTSFVGQGPIAAVDASRRPLRLRAGDRLLVCSDGLYNGLDERTMAALLKQSPTPHDAAEKLVDKVLAQQIKGQDNVTVLIMECDEDVVTVRRKTASNYQPEKKRLSLPFFRWANKREG
jgi:serine/threonine protein phosphatase PrpC